MVFPAKFRKKILTEKVKRTLKEVSLEISDGYEIHFVEIGTDEDHVHFLVQSVPSMSITKMVRIIKSITAKEIFQKNPEVKEQLWGGNLWTSGYYANTVGRYGNEEVIKDYVKNQGKQYRQLHRDQLVLFDGVG